MTDLVDAGVIGVGSMGRNHARIYQELSAVNLVGVADADEDRASEVAESYDTEAMKVERLLDFADAVSIVVPTQYHYPIARGVIESGVDLLVEKPFVEDPERGRELVERAEDRDVTLQVGHIERFNPAIRTLEQIVPDLDVIAIDGMRLGPPLNRDIDTNPVLDLMIHDLDIVLSIVGDSPTSIDARHASGHPYSTAGLTFEDTIATLTASRATQRKVRKLSITARECWISVDYIDQSIEIHRSSLPEYVEKDGNIRYRNQSVIERPMVENGEPLKHELRSFVEATQSDEEPVVTGEDGIAALRLARRICDVEGTRRQSVEVKP